MLAPKRILHRKVQRGSMKGQAKGNTELHFGEFGIQALEAPLDHQPSDRGRSYCHDPLHEAWRSCLHHDLPR